MKDYTFSLGELVCAIRKINKMTQVEYSKNVGVVQSTISKVEKDIFDDVPFSLMSTISQQFKIPLQYFQIGHLPLRKSANLQNTVGTKYTQQGMLHTQTIFHILTTLEKKHPDIYKKIKLPYVYLSLSNIKYNLELIHQLYIKYTDDLLDAIKIIFDQIPQSEININELKSCLEDYETISIHSSSDTHLKFHLDRDLKELDRIYLDILRLDISFILGKQLNASISKESDYFLLENI